MKLPLIIVLSFLAVGMIHGQDSPLRINYHADSTLRAVVYKDNLPLFSQNQALFFSNLNLTGKVTYDLNYLVFMVEGAGNFANNEASGRWQRLFLQFDTPWGAIKAGKDLYSQGGGYFQSHWQVWNFFDETKAVADDLYLTQISLSFFGDFYHQLFGIYFDDFFTNWPFDNKWYIVSWLQEFYLPSITIWTQAAYISKEENDWHTGGELDWLLNDNLTLTISGAVFGREITSLQWSVSSGGVCSLPDSGLAAGLELFRDVNWMGTVFCSFAPGIFFKSLSGLVLSVSSQLNIKDQGYLISGGLEYQLDENTKLKFLYRHWGGSNESIWGKFPFHRELFFTVVFDF